MSSRGSMEDAAQDGLGRRAAQPAHRWGFGAFFLAQAVFIGVSVLLIALLGQRQHLAGALIAMLTVPTLLTGAVAIAVTILRGNGPQIDLGLSFRWADVRTGLKLGGVGLLLTTGATVLWSHWVGDQATSAIAEILAEVRLPPVLAILIFVHIWLVAPLCEELLYRGLLWGAMERLRWSQATAFVLTTAVLAIGHLEPSRTLLLLVIAIPIGLARWVSGGLTASVVAHQVNNFLPAVGLLLMSLGAIPA